jgi:hypothetical protein
MAELDDDLPIAKTTPASTSAAVTDDLDVDWGDQDAMTVSDGLDRIEPADKTSKVRCAVLSDVVKPKMAWGHFVTKPDGKKTFIRCHTKRGAKHVVIGELAACCKKLNHDDNQKAQLNFAVLAFKYIGTNPKTGKFDADADGNLPPIRWEIGFLKLSISGYKRVGELTFEGEKPHEFDFSIAHKENKIGFEYSRLSKGLPRFRQNPELVKEVLAEAAKFADGVVLSKKLGKVISDVDLKALLSTSAAAPAKGQQIDNTDDL